MSMEYDYTMIVFCPFTSGIPSSTPSLFMEPPFLVIDCLIHALLEAVSDKEDYLLIKLDGLFHSSSDCSASTPQWEQSPHSLFPPCWVLLRKVQHSGSAACVVPHIEAPKTPPLYIIWCAYPVVSSQKVQVAMLVLSLQMRAQWHLQICKHQKM